MNILPGTAGITIQTDNYDWTSLTINGANYPALGANVTVNGDVTFEAEFNGSPSSMTSFPMVLQNPSDPSQMWFADVNTAADGSSCKISGTVKSFSGAQIGSSPESFNANGLTASFRVN